MNETQSKKVRGEEGEEGRAKDSPIQDKIDKIGNKPWRKKPIEGPNFEKQELQGMHMRDDH